MECSEEGILVDKKISRTFKSKHISISIDRPAEQVYEFASNPENLPKWAAGLSGSIKNVNGDWIARKERCLNCFVLSGSSKSCRTSITHIIRMLLYSTI